MARRTAPRKIEPPTAGLAAMVTPVPAENYWIKGLHAQLIDVAMSQKVVFAYRTDVRFACHRDR
jgi:hypothetical protein